MPTGITVKNGRATGMPPGRTIYKDEAVCRRGPSSTGACASAVTLVRAGGSRSGPPAQRQTVACRRAAVIKYSHRSRLAMASPLPSRHYVASRSVVADSRPVRHPSLSRCCGRSGKNRSQPPPIRLLNGGFATSFRVAAPSWNGCDVRSTLRLAGFIAANVSNARFSAELRDGNGRGS